MAGASRTINPLHFEDLEPHRFEDLVRQLIYDYRDWKSIEATGRAGSDDGFDVRAWENVYPEEPSVEDEENEGVIIKPEHRIWLIQCKREKTITPKKLTKYVQDIKINLEQPIYGAIFVASCDFSKKSRDAFSNAIREKGVQEFYLWGKAELEDMLFQPKNDHLLFAYFGFSLRIRRRSLKTQIRSKLSIKRKIIKHITGISRSTYHNGILIRDAYDKNYPYKEEVKDFHKNPKWWPYEPAGHYYDGIKFVVKKLFAYLADDGLHWDYVSKVNKADIHDNPWKNEYTQKNHEREDRVWRYWLDIPKGNQAWLKTIKCIPYDRILEIDENGDEDFPHPHIYIEPNSTQSFFEEMSQVILKTIGIPSISIYFPTEKNKIEYFPKRFPKQKKPAL